ncbi:ABC transporter substrate-binding protein [Clostridium sp. Marseille-P2415]|uniref:ABC transporter substrate-binding protein n=1 Tax=Clostridium sp. Marseille-P2415 TaxID=1805471 RepID=UPI0009883B40|nr:ABC transporter substrate-binding protein [Clostridium sp. Marseille-P2415]
MKLRFKTTSLLLASMLLLTACASNNNKDTSASSAVESVSEETTTAGGESETDSKADSQLSGTHIVVDHGGNRVEVPNKIDRIIIDQIPILSTYMAYFKGSAPHIVGYSGSFKETISETALKNIAPELLESSDTVYAQSELNIEEIIKLKPDVIFYNANNKEHAQILASSGIPSIGFATVGADSPADPIERYKEWLILLEEVFGEKGKMDGFIEAGNKIIEDVETRIENIPEDKRPSTMILFKLIDGVPQVSGKGVFGDYWLQHLGVKNVAGETKGFAQVSFEQIYEWNPQVLFLNGPGLLKLNRQDVIDNKVEGVDFSTIQAVKDERVYNTTLGMWNWFTPNPDAPLVLAWLAYNTYPEEFKDYPLETVIRDYYQNFYGYEITDEEMKGMLQLR